MKCKNCSKKEGIKYSKYASGEFCSTECSHSFSTKNDIKGYKKIICIKCGKDIVVDKRAGSKSYCSECKPNRIKTPSIKPIKVITKNFCKTCGEEIPKRKRYCKDCIGKRERERMKNNNYNYDYVLNWRNDNKRQAVDYLGGKCKVCGYNKCTRSLQFHHLTPSEKEMTISKNINKMKFEKLKPELDKCILVCSNCHGEIHDGLIIL